MKHDSGQLTQQNKNQGPNIPSTAHTTPTATATRTLAQIKLGCPGVTTYPGYEEQADNTTQYSITIQARDDSQKCAVGGKPVAHLDGITCKIWLTKSIPQNTLYKFSDDVNTSILQHPEKLDQPIPGKVNNDDYPELQNALTFDATTPQTHACDENGTFTWKYTIASSVNPGDYSLIILTDYQGITWNWSWRGIKVTK